ncbi:MAG: toll/interleukin-1 receptor domain-containing protein [Chloroflexota bacterium]
MSNEEIYTLFYDKYAYNYGRLTEDISREELIDWITPANPIPAMRHLLSSDKPAQSLQVFLCHASEDKPIVKDLYHRLRADRFKPWLDEIDLLPGQHWQQEIPKAVQSSDVILVCLSKNAVSKAGYIQKEISFALDIAQEQPQDTIFLIPLKLEDCDVPHQLDHLQWGTLFDDQDYERLLQSLLTRSEASGVTKRISPSLTLKQPSNVALETRNSDATQLGPTNVDKGERSQLKLTKTIWWITGLFVVTFSLVMMIYQVNTSDHEIPVVEQILPKFSGSLPSLQNGFEAPSLNILGFLTADRLTVDPTPYPPTGTPNVNVTKTARFLNTKKTAGAIRSTLTATFWRTQFPTVTPTPFPLEISIDFGQPNYSSGLSQIEMCPRDGCTKVQVIEGLIKGGKSMNKSVRTSANDHSLYIYFKIPPAFLQPKADTYIITVEYLDRGFAKLGVDYDSTDKTATAGGLYKHSDWIELENTGHWKSYQFILDDAQFAGRQHNGADFRIARLRDSGEFFISKVSISRSHNKSQ